MSAPARRTEAASFRCRRRRFRTPLTAVLALLTVLMLAGFYRTRYLGYESYFTGSCVHAMDELLLVEKHWETQPPATRWVAWCWDRESFFDTHKLYAEAARRDGYLDDNIRLRMVTACHYHDRPAEARMWESGIADPSSRSWCEHFRGSSNVREALDEFQRTVAEDGPEDPRSMDLAGTAAGTYQSLWRSNALTLGVMAAGLPFLWPLLRLLLRRGHAPGRRSRLLSRWTPEHVTGAWLRAEWLFLFGGLVLSVLGGMALWGYEPDAPAAAQRLAEGYYGILEALHQSVWRNVFYAALMAAPVFLMVRWLTPGFHSTLRLFGIRRCPMKETQLLRLELAALTLVGLLYIAFGFIDEWSGLTDPRDGWSREDDHVWETILYGCILAPFMEEFIYRGFLFTAFRERWGVVTAATVSSLLFAVLHGYSVTGTAAIFLFGMLLCALYHRTGTLRLPLMVHAMTNLLLIW